MVGSGVDWKRGVVWRLLALVLAVVAGPGSGRAKAAGATRERPNILFILADDLGYGDLGCYGQERIRTPRLDGLARQGTRFTAAYAGATVCAPSRCVLMTGRHTGHARVRGNAGRANPMAQSLRAGDVTVGRLLLDAGYRTALVGKWGLGDAVEAEPGLPERHGFTHMFGYLNQTHAHNHYPSFLWRNGQRIRLGNVVTNETPTGAGTAVVRREYSQDLFVSEALRFIEEERDNRFFLYLALTTPHANNEAGRAGMEVPELGAYADLDWPAPQKGHAAMITRLDRDVGRVLDLLDTLGLAERTLVVFTSDNGPHREGGNDPGFNRSSGPFRGIKRDHTDGGIRVPMLVRWPGVVPAGRTDGTVWWFADVLPTLAAVGGAVVPAGVDGVSVLPTWRGLPQPGLRDRFLYWEFHEGGFKQAGRWQDWKILRNRKDGPTELYDLGQDIGETNNVAAAHPELVARLETLLRESRVESPDWPVR